MLTRTRSSSFVVNGALTRAVQFAGRSTGQGDNKALIASVPRALDHRLPHRHSCARSTSPADNGLRSTYRNSPSSVSARPYQSRRRERQVLACAGLRGPADYWLTRRRPLMPLDLHSVYFDELGSARLSHAMLASSRRRASAKRTTFIQRRRRR